MTGGLAQRSHLRVATGTRSWSPYVRTNERTEKELQLRGNLSVRTACANGTIRALLIAGLVMHAATRRKPKSPVHVGTHRAPHEPFDWRARLAAAWAWVRRTATPVMWVVTIAIWLWVTYQSAVIELPPAVAVAATFTACLSFAAGRSAGRRDA